MWCPDKYTYQTNKISVLEINFCEYWLFKNELSSFGHLVKYFDDDELY